MLPPCGLSSLPGGQYASSAWCACGVAVFGCSSGSPSSPEEFRSLASILGGSADNATAPPTIFNTQMRNELESPACASDAKGHAHIDVGQDGSINSRVTLVNKGERVRFGHIHHLNQGALTGPIIWWLTSPVGTDLDLTDKHLTFVQAGTFVSNTHFTDHATALAALLANPQEFYVNFHSDNCPGGFARGFLP